MLIVVGILLFLCLIFVIDIRGNIYLLDASATLYIYLYNVRVFKMSLVVVDNHINLVLGRFGCLQLDFTAKKKRYFDIFDLINIRYIRVFAFLGVESAFMYNITSALNQILQLITKFLTKKVYIGCYPISFREDATIKVDSRCTFTMLDIIYSLFNSLKKRIKSIKEKSIYDNA